MVSDSMPEANWASGPGCSPGKICSDPGWPGPRRLAVAAIAPARPSYPSGGGLRRVGSVLGGLVAVGQDLGVVVLLFPVLLIVPPGLVRIIRRNRFRGMNHHPFGTGF